MAGSVLRAQRRLVVDHDPGPEPERRHEAVSAGSVVGVQKAEGRALRLDQPGGAGLGTLSDPDYPPVRRASVLGNSAGGQTPDRGNGRGAHRLKGGRPHLLPAVKEKPRERSVGMPP